MLDCFWCCSCFLFLGFLLFFLFFGFAFVYACLFCFVCVGVFFFFLLLSLFDLFLICSLCFLDWSRCCSRFVLFGLFCLCSLLVLCVCFFLLLIKVTVFLAILVFWFYCKSESLLLMSVSGSCFLFCCVCYLFQDVILFCCSACSLALFWIIILDVFLLCILFSCCCCFLFLLLWYFYRFLATYQKTSLKNLDIAKKRKWKMQKKRKRAFWQEQLAQVCSQIASFFLFCGSLNFACFVKSTKNRGFSKKPKNRKCRVKHWSKVVLKIGPSMLRNKVGPIF